jgi:hypothetical protein
LVLLVGFLRPCRKTLEQCLSCSMNASFCVLSNLSLIYLTTQNSLDSERVPLNKCYINAGHVSVRHTRILSPSMRECGFPQGFQTNAMRCRISTPGSVKNVLLATSSRSVLQPIQPIRWVSGTLSPWVMRPGREADHSPPTSADVKKTWIYTSIAPPPYLN